MRRPERVRFSGRVHLAVLVLLCAAPEALEAKCPYDHVEVRGQVREFGGEPIEGAEIIVFVDNDSDAVFDQKTDRAVWRTDPKGRFTAQGAFVDWAWPRWWHRFSSVIDQCGRDPGSFTIVVQAAGFHPKQFVIRASDDAVEEVADGRFVVELRIPLELLRWHSAG